MDKKTLINLIDIMVGLTESEIKRLNSQSYEDVLNEYKLKYLDQNDEQLDLVYERMK
ncbi:hypothetical protein [Mammaliicoccus sciuri]|uniref:hypothetical protein n=1 Tax=Mammaliicoccus sciuri TaxID=1296 RepID=UPI0015F969CF|nr:hypothetical protein [Mammaliicoccus sciuri]